MAFGSLLVANRGEIAVRVLRSARAAGLQTVAVYSDADREAPHVREADVAVRLGPAPATQSYLSIPALLEAARRSGAEAVHPGYGFLSERAAFARACEEAGLVFVGPPADVIDRMGRKDVARHVAVVADVPVVPAVEGADDTELAERAVAEVGFPLLVKAAAGGGGKGMRIVRTAGELPAALAAARREAASAFGDDTMLVERYVELGRHVEVQVLGDAHGTVVHLYERDCSVQRRHQKVIEEAPAPTISAALRERLTSAAVRLSREVGYVNAGTVEFLVDATGQSEDAYFLEMNTRLQVEHPVTELVTGLDLVRLQLDVAQGLPLPFTQDDVTLSGSAVEARVYAEDPAAGFLPQAGVATAVRWSDRARVDHALESGQRVETWYDPMLGKVIAHGPTREAARRSLVAALDDTAVLGLTTNLGFLRRLAASPQFRDAAVDTAWLDRVSADGPAFPAETPEVALVLAAWVVAAAPVDRDVRHPFAALDGFRLAGPPAPVVVELDAGPSGRGERHVLHVDVAAGAVTEDGRRWEVHPLAVQAGGAVGQVRLEVDGVLVESEVEVGPHGVTVAHHGEAYRFTVPDAFGPAGSAAAADGSVAAPMPGVVLAVHVAAGDRVEQGQVLGVLEAMKMELALSAPLAGVVQAVGAAVGDRVVLGQQLFAVAAPDDEEG